jgi:hypothetical protein
VAEVGRCSLIKPGSDTTSRSAHTSNTLALIPITGCYAAKEGLDMPLPPNVGFFWPKDYLGATIHLDIFGPTEVNTIGLALTQTHF